MVRLEKSIEIKASPEKVWEILALDRLPEWDEGYKENLKSVEYTSTVRTPKDKYKVGAYAHGIPKKKGEEWSFDITDSLENEKITYGMKGGRYKGVIVTSILEPVGDGTKFTFVVDAELPWGGFWQVPRKIVIRKRRKRGREIVREVEEHSEEIDAHWNSNLSDASKQLLISTIFSPLFRVSSMNLSGLSITSPICHLIHFFLFLPF